MYTVALALLAGANAQSIASLQRGTPAAISSEDIIRRTLTSAPRTTQTHLSSSSSPVIPKASVGSQSRSFVSASAPPVMSSLAPIIPSLVSPLEPSISAPSVAPRVSNGFAMTTTTSPILETGFGGAATTSSTAAAAGASDQSTTTSDFYPFETDSADSLTGTAISTFTPPSVSWESTRTSKQTGTSLPNRKEFNFQFGSTNPDDLEVQVSANQNQQSNYYGESDDGSSDDEEDDGSSSSSSSPYESRSLRRDVEINPINASIPLGLNDTTIPESNDESLPYRKEFSFQFGSTNPDDLEVQVNANEPYMGTPYDNELINSGENIDLTKLRGRAALEPVLHDVVYVTRYAQGSTTVLPIPVSSTTVTNEQTTTVTEKPVTVTATAPAVTITAQPLTVSSQVTAPVTVPVTVTAPAVQAPPVTITAEPETVTAAPVTVTASPFPQAPVTVTADPVTVTAAAIPGVPVTVTANPVTVTAPALPQTPITVTSEVTLPVYVTVSGGSSSAIPVPTVTVTEQSTVTIPVTNFDAQNTAPSNAPGSYQQGYNDGYQLGSGQCISRCNLANQQAFTQGYVSGAQWGYQYGYNDGARGNAYIPPVFANGQQPTPTPSLAPQTPPAQPTYTQQWTTISYWVPYGASPSPYAPYYPPYGQRLDEEGDPSAGQYVYEAVACDCAAESPRAEPEADVNNGIPGAAATASSLHTSTQFASATMEALAAVHTTEAAAAASTNTEKTGVTTTSTIVIEEPMSSSSSSLQWFASQKPPPSR